MGWGGGIGGVGGGGNAFVVRGSRIFPLSHLKSCNRKSKFS